MTQLYLNTDKDFLLLNSSGDWLILDSQSPTAYPATPAPMEVTVTSYAPTLVSVTHGLRRSARSRGAHAWQFELRYSGMTRATFAPLWAFLVKQGGQASTFAFTPPGLTNRGAGGGTPAVAGGGQTGTSLVTDGWPNGTAILKAGDWIQVEADPKVYMVTEDVSSDGGGNATIELTPALRMAPADNASLSTTPVFTCALTEDMLAVDWGQCLHALGVTINLVEAT